MPEVLSPSRSLLLLAFLHAWILYPALLLLVFCGLGLLVERAAGARLPGVLLAPLGLATLIAVAALTTAAPATAPLTSPVVAVLAVAGLVVGGRNRRPERAPTLALLAVFLAYGAPVLLSGEATFAGYLRLDDTASWLALTDQVMAHGRSLADVPPSTHRELLASVVPQGYPLGAFTPPGVASQLSGLDGAWGFAPYLALCGLTLAASMYALIEPLGLSRRLRSVVVAAAAQPALLYGYVQWGGIKEITVATATLLLVVLGTALIVDGPGKVRAALPFAVVSGALIAVVGPGGVGFIGPVFAAVVGTWLWRGRAAGLRASLRPIAQFTALAFLCTLPTLASLASTLTYTTMFFDEARDRATLYGNLIRPIRGWQLGGVWFARDFRIAPAQLPTIILLVAVALAAAWGLIDAVRRRAVGLPLYVGVSLLAVLASLASGGSPWLMGKALAIASPAIPLAALCGAALLVTRSRWGIPLVGVLVGGIVGSNVLIYTDVTLAPRERLAEVEALAHVVKGRGPTFDNHYETYAARHFLREAAAIEPAEVRGAPLKLIDGRFLIQAATADIDAFPPETLAPYPSLVVSRAPTASRPSSAFEPVWQSKRYVVYRQTGVGTLVRHVPLGDSRSLPYCGNAQNAGPLPLCAVQPVDTPTCRTVKRLGRQAAEVGASLVAAVRPAPIVLRGDDVRWPASWVHDPVGHTLTPMNHGTATARVRVSVAGRYGLWLGGAFARGFTVRIDGEVIGRVRHELGSIGGSVPVGSVTLAPGLHTIQLTYPTAGYGPGEADASHLTLLASIALAPPASDAQLLAVPAAAADTLCGRPLDWIDLVR